MSAAENCVRLLTPAECEAHLLRQPMDTRGGDQRLITSMRVNAALNPLPPFNPPPMPSAGVRRALDWLKRAEMAMRHGIGSETVTAALVRAADAYELAKESE